MNLDRRQLLLSGAALGLLWPGSARAGKPIVLVVTSETNERSTTIAQTYRERLTWATRMSYDLGGDPASTARIADTIRDVALSLVFTIGDLGMRTAAREFVGLPVIYADVSDASIVATMANAVGVAAQVDPDATLPRLKLLLPKVKRIGVVARSGDTDPYWDHLVARAGEHGVQVTVARAGSAAEVKNVVTALLLGNEMLWLHPDPVLWTAGTLTATFYDASLKAIPVVGFNPAHLDSPTPPPLVVAASAAGIGASAARLSSRLLGVEVADAEAAAYAQPTLWASRAGLRACGAYLSKKNTPAVDTVLK
jgi:ABC-type uncharacterized transport system substrate-binding protein